MKLKKIVSVLLVIVLVLVCAVSAFAATPRWSNTSMIAPNILALSNGYSADVIGNVGVSKIACTMVLYEKGFWGNYTEVARKSDTAYSSAANFRGEYTYKSGKTYKLEVTVTVYLNGVGETITTSCENKV